jgi:hypothetical protein
MLLPNGVNASPLTQELPTGQAGGAPMLVISLTTHSSTQAKMPVNPAPDNPPLSVKIVTVWPIYLIIL